MVRTESPHTAHKKEKCARTLILTEGEAESAFGDLSGNYRIIAPVEKEGAGRLSGTSLVTYDEVGRLGEIEFFKKTHYSAKSALLPIRETLFTFKDNRAEAVNGEVRPTVLFLRACDIHAFSVLDAHFLRNGGGEDPYYGRRRRNTKFFLIECARPFDNCFCVSLGTNRTSDYAVFIRKTDAGYEARIQDREMEEYFSAGVEGYVEPRFAENDSALSMRPGAEPGVPAAPLRLPEEIDVSLFKADMWKEYSSRCIACGRCNVCCPTCTCFTMQDLPAKDPELTGERRRIWSSCQVKDFGLMAGGHDFRIPAGDRMRYKVLHKLHDFKKRTGTSMCVGCGRCDDACPEYISMFNCAEKINRIARSVGTRKSGPDVPSGGTSDV